jgi:hypothetical protein
MCVLSFDDGVEDTMEPSPASMIVWDSVFLDAAFEWLIDNWFVAIKFAFPLKFL